MANFIDENYFKFDISIPNLDAEDSDIDDVIAKYEPEILTKVLGYRLYALIKDNSDESGIYYDLINGKIYTAIDENDVKWNGLKNSEDISLIAYYVYVNWQKYHVTNTTNVGEVANEVELSSRANPAQKMGSAWTKMRQLVGYAGQDILEPSLYNFLKEHESSYPEWKFKDVGRVTFLI